MVSATSEAEHPGLSRPIPLGIKVVVSGGFGVGKTTLIGSVSEIKPLHTEEPLTSAGVGTDSLSGVEAKRTTTVAMDFGRIFLTDSLVLYLFGTPGQDRFWFLWDELAIGALGAVVLADTRRLADCFAAVDYFEQRGIPFLVACNCFHGEQPFDVGAVRDALDLDEGVPVMMCDARDRESSKQVLAALVEHVMARRAAVTP
ncbi:ATP/GTP-binding protein [Luedemannella flava]|uniref:ATP/GTP-binding protein n=1 Tax=Luedemannella flava TaxID=349316 RepID=A0ABN2LZ41_9ACTN